MSRFFCLLAFISLPSSLLASDPLEILLVEKAPYYYSSDRGAQGFLSDHFACMMGAAKISTVFHFQPINRVLYRIKTDKKACSLGWFRTASRERFAVFSLGVWTDDPMAVVVHRDSLARFAALGSMQKMLATPGLSAVIPENVSFGEDLDRMIHQSKHNIQMSTINFVQSLTMVANKRVDYTIANVPEYKWHKKLEKERSGRDVMELVHYSDMPGGEERYLMCHKEFAQDAMEAINQAIRRYKKDCGLKNAAP